MRSKARLTITLSHDLLAKVDRLIDKQTVRNRSHAIEMLLRQSIVPEVETAVLLAGGPARRGDIPCLVPIGGKPLISRTVEHLASHGIRRFVVLAGKRGDAVRGHLGDGHHLGVEIEYVMETRPLGTAGAVRRARKHLESGPFLTVNADVLTDIDISGFIRFHRGENTLATIAVKPRQVEKNYGKVVLEGNRILEFIHRSRSGGISIVNTGVYLLEPEVLDLIDQDKPSRLETDVFPRLAAQGELGAFFFQGIWFDVSTPENRRLAETRWRQSGGSHHARHD